MKWRVRHSITVAVGITLIEIVATTAVETRLEVDRPFVAVRDTAGCMLGSVHTLVPGQYRWRVEVARAPRSASVTSSLPVSDITRPLVVMGMLDADRNEFG